MNTVTDVPVLSPTGMRCVREWWSGQCRDRYGSHDGDQKRPNPSVKRPGGSLAAETAGVQARRKERTESYMVKVKGFRLSESSP